jgi:alpha-tubulin suppressor-like RCC1 family protein
MLISIKKPTSYHFRGDLNVFVLLTDDGTVWGCGWNAYGQLGAPPEQVKSSWKMRRLELPDGNFGTVMGIECGGWSTAVFLA